MYLLDTSVCLAFICGTQTVVDRIKPNLDRCYIPAMVFGELCAATHRLIPPDQRLLQDFLYAFKDKVVEFDGSAAEEFGRISMELRQCGGKQHFEEMRLAALARLYKATIVTDENRAGRFDSIRVNLTTSWFQKEVQYEIIFPPTIDEPGILYNVAQVFARLRINIEEAHGSVYDNNLKFSRLYCPSDLSIGTLISEMRHGTGLEVPCVTCNSREVTNSNELISQNNRFFIRIDFHRLERKNIQVRAFLITGIDRAGLVSDITEIIFNNNLNIIRFGSTTTEQPYTEDGRNFEISLSFYDDSNVDWEEIINRISTVTVHGVPLCICQIQT